MTTFLHKYTIPFLLILITRFSNCGAQRTTVCQLESEVYKVQFDDSIKSFVVYSEFNNIDSQVHDAKLCNCDKGRPATFCLLHNNENHCSTTYLINGNGNNICFHITMFYGLKQMFWTPIYFSFVILTVALFTTRCGKFARDYVLRKCFPCINARVINRILQLERDARNQYRRSGELARYRPDGMRERLSLQLKTKKMQTQTRTQTQIESGPVSNTADNLNQSASKDTHESSHDTEANAVAVTTKEIEGGIEDDADEITCSICMVPLENGERVGDLPCGHNFHVECLKTWVLWRNTCPLCNASDIAKTRIQLVPRDDDGDGENAGEDDSGGAGETLGESSTNTRDRRRSRLRSLFRES